MKKAYLFIASLTVMMFAAKANNVQVANVSLTGQNTGAGLNNVANYTNVKFDISWENSWRVSGANTANNWDAVWVFVKYKESGSGQLYQHAIIDVTAGNHSVGTTNGVPVTITPTADGMGVFMYRSGDGSGNINWQDVNLRWRYRLAPNAVHDTMQVTVQVFAIEMVYIPEGSFYLGDGNMAFAPSLNSFRVNNQSPTYPKGNEAYLVTSENAITFVNSSSTSLTGVYDPWYPNGYTVPATYPKGYNAIYCMKYEITQKQYVDFFNTLASGAATQKNSRNLGNTGSYRNNFSWNGVAGNDATLTGGVSGDRAQNYMVWADGCAYADWAGLRPMSDFEYEKVSRGNCAGIGPVYPTNPSSGQGEFAWGNNIIKNITSALVNDGTISENLNSADTANANYNNNANAQGPVRNGIFAAKNLTIPGNTKKRKATGASFYGVMELSGNLWELVVSCYQPTWQYSSNVPYPSAFSSSVHGDGTLNTSGNANIGSWSWYPPVGEVNMNNHTSYYQYYNATYGSGNVSRRGGSWLSTDANMLRTSYRGTDAKPYGYNGTGSPCYCTPTSSNPSDVTYTSRQRDNGFRCVRTAP